MAPFIDYGSRVASSCSRSLLDLLCLIYRSPLSRLDLVGGWMKPNKVPPHHLGLYGDRCIRELSEKTAKAQPTIELSARGSDSNTLGCLGLDGGGGHYSAKD